MAPGFDALRLARVLAGATAAAVIPLSMAWIGDVVDYERRQPVLARFLIGQLRTLADADSRQAIDAYGMADGLVWGKHRDGSVLVPLPVDHLSWTAPLAAALAAPARSGASLGVVKVSGSVSPMARQRLQAAGWRVDARVASAQ